MGAQELGSLTDRRPKVVRSDCGLAGWRPALEIAFDLFSAMSVLRFPNPTGTHPISTLTYNWADARRAAFASPCRQLFEPGIYPKPHENLSLCMYACSRLAV